MEGGQALAMHGHSQQEVRGPVSLVTANATTPQVQDVRERWCSDRANHGPQISDKGTQEKLSLVTSFVGQKTGNTFIFLTSAEKNFSTVMMKQMLLSVCST